jgi:hypothetical protein
LAGARPLRAQQGTRLLWHLSDPCRSRVVGRLRYG